MKIKWPRPPEDTRTLSELQDRLEEVEDEMEDLRNERRELEARIAELERLDDDLLNDDLAGRAKRLLADSHTEYLCWPEISALESLLSSPTYALIKRVRQILGNHNRLYA